MRRDGIVASRHPDLQQMRALCMSSARYIRLHGAYMHLRVSFFLFFLALLFIH